MRFSLRGDSLILRNACQLQQPLKSAVLAISAVKHGEGNVYGNPFRSGFLQQEQAAVSPAGGKDTGLSSALCMDKDRAHRLVSLAGIRVPGSLVLSTPIPAASDLSREICYQGLAPGQSRCSPGHGRFVWQLP